MRDLARGQQIRCKTTECSSWPQPAKRLRLTPSLARSSTEQAWWRGKAGSHIKAGHASLLLPLFTFTIQHDTTELHLPQNTPCRSPQTQKKLCLRNFINNSSYKQMGATARCFCPSLYFGSAHGASMLQQGKLTQKSEITIS